MSAAYDLADDEYEVLRSALDGPLLHGDTLVVGLCHRLCGRQLLQRAGEAARTNGWRGSPYAFVLTRQGWSLLKEVRGVRTIQRSQTA